MHAVNVFDENVVEYDRWFDEHEHLYQAELSALRRFVPSTGFGVEIGVGTGRFAAPLRIRIGVEPARRMAQKAQSRGIAVCQAVGEQLPFADDQFDFALLVTVVCFVKDVSLLLRETQRVLSVGGRIIVGFIEKDSTLGQLYQSRKGSDPFYRIARFYSGRQIANEARRAGFADLQFCQTIFGLPTATAEVPSVRDGYGEGAFVVLCAKKFQVQ